MADKKDDQKYPDPYPGTRPDFASGKTVSEMLADAIRERQIEAERKKRGW